MVIPMHVRIGRHVVSQPWDGSPGANRRRRVAVALPQCSARVNANHIRRPLQNGWRTRHDQGWLEPDKRLG